jgi:hypothetical protein
MLLGHPDERPVINDTEAGLRFAITTMTTDATCEVSAANASRALRGI